MRRVANDLVEIGGSGAPVVLAKNFAHRGGALMFVDGVIKLENVLVSFDARPLVPTYRCA